jgi:hypothetical protein
MQLSEAELKALAAAAGDRYDLWISFLKHLGAASIAEVGVFRGAFAERLLDDCPAIERYYMIDPWRHLEDWNKPANREDDRFEGFYQEVMERTAAHADKRIVLRGRTAEVVDQIPDESLDFAYIDGDHTLRGITIDLVKVLPKIRPGGWIGGDDFCKSIFQHSSEYEPTLVFPFAVHFAEAMDLPIYALPHRQFLIHNDPGAGHAFVDLAGAYADTGLKRQIDRVRRPKPAAKRPGVEKLPSAPAARASVVRRGVNRARGMLKR